MPSCVNAGRCWKVGVAFCVLLATARFVQAAVVFPGEFAPGANWVMTPDKGSISMDSSSIVITGAPGSGSGTTSSMDLMNYVGPGNNGVSQQTKITFHWKLDPGNSMNASAIFLQDGSPTTLTYTIYGGMIVEGDYSTIIPQYGKFQFGLDNMIYKSSPATLTITQFVVEVPEASTWWGSTLFVLGFGWHYGRRGRQKAKISV